MAGEIDQIGTPLEVYATPATRFVGGFIGSPPMNFIAARRDAGAGAAIGDGDAALPRLGDGDIVLGLRGEDASLAPAGTGLPFDVRVVEPMGSHLLLTGAIDGQLARIVAPPTATVEAGERVGLVSTRRA